MIIRLLEKGVQMFNRILSICLLIIIVLPVRAEELVGKVIRVSDGDTINILVSKRKIRIRFADIDTPEKAQPWGKRAKSALSELVARKNVVVKVKGRDRYGRVIGTVMLNGVDINARMVATGNAWVYRRYSKRRDYIQLEKTARKKQIGLWSLPAAEQIPPWKWRRQNSRNP